VSEGQKTAVVFGLANKRSICLGHCAEAKRSGLAAGNYVSERAAGAGSKGFDHGFAGRGRLHVRRDFGRGDCEIVRAAEKRGMACWTDWCTASRLHRRKN